MLDKKKSEQIYSLVREQPRTIQEIAQALEVSWLTAERYVQKLASESGMIAAKTFRGGTKGALKIVYWNLLQSSTSSVQHRLEEQVVTGRLQSDWSAAELYFQVDPKQKKARMVGRDKYTTKETGDIYASLLLQATDTILFFSGNFTFLDIPTSKGTIYDTLVELAERGVQMKILCRISVFDTNNLERIEAINKRSNKQMIEVRHEYQPTRATIIDDKIISIKEVYDHKMFTKEELPHEVVVFYEIYETLWVKWMQRVFWKLYQSAIGARQFLEDMHNIKDVEKHLVLE